MLTLYFCRGTNYIIKYFFITYMKKTTRLLLLFSLALTGCTLLNPYKTVEDEFRNSKTLTFEQRLFAAEHSTGVSHANVTYERVISPTEETLNIYFVMARSTSSFGIDKKGFMKANGEKYEIYLENYASELRTSQESSTTSTTTKDSTKVKTENTTNISNSSWYDDKFIVRLTPDMLSSLNKTNELLFRFYLGPQQATFKLRGYTLKGVQKLLDK